jgi:FKBP-type peptidyl-prolyl cis-trans isomerase FkpA
MFKSALTASISIRAPSTLGNLSMNSSGFAVLRSVGLHGVAFRIAAAVAATAICIGAHAQADLPASAAKEKGAVVTPSGLVYLSLRDGSGPSPAATDVVKVNYRGTFADGKEFDSSYKRNSPAQFPLNGVIPCWTEGVQRMKVGGKARLTCPAKIAYGERGAGGTIPPNTPLQFEVELLEIAKQ